MKFMTNYYIEIKSGNEKLDKSWYESAQSFQTDIALCIGEKISFNNPHDWQAELTKDYNTKLFRIVDRITRIEDMGNSDVAIEAWVDIYLEPVYSGNFINIFLEDYNETIACKSCKSKSGEDFDKWSFWFEGEGCTFLNDFPNVMNAKAGDILEVFYTNELFNSGKLKRNFYDDWGTYKIRVKERVFYYSDMVVTNNEYSEELPANKPPYPSLFLHIELVDE